MKLVVILLSLTLVGCLSLGETEEGSAVQTTQESYFVPVIRSDTSSTGYTPTVTPIIEKKTTSRIYTSVFR